MNTRVSPPYASFQHVTSITNPLPPLVPTMSVVDRHTHTHTHTLSNIRSPLSLARTHSLVSTRLRCSFPASKPNLVLVDEHSGGMMSCALRETMLLGATALCFYACVCVCVCVYSCLTVFEKTVDFQTL